MPYAKYTGSLTIEPPLNTAEIKALSAFFDSRRIVTMGGPLDCRMLPPRHPDVIDPSRCPDGQPGQWCDLMVSADGRTLSWNGSDHTEPNLHAWIAWLIDHLLKSGAEYDIRERGYDLSAMSDDNLLRSFTFDHYVTGELVANCPDEIPGVWKVVVHDNEVSTANVQLTLAQAVEDED